MSHEKYSLPDLPYPYEALEPVISKEIMTLHHDKHHKAYVDKANELLEKLEAAREKGEMADVGSIAKKLSFNVDGHILHNMFWNNMQSQSDFTEPTGELLEKINADFGSFERFKAEFSEVATTIEGSGWAILHYDLEIECLVISQVGNHNLALVLGPVLLALDMWEHSYYLDYKNDKKTFTEKFWTIVNWGEVARRLENAKGMINPSEI